MTPSYGKLKVLVASTGSRDTSWAQTLVVRLSKDTHIEMRAIVDDVVPRLTQTVIVMQNQRLRCESGNTTEDVEHYRQHAFDMADWADMMVCLPLDADSITKMLTGVCDTLLGAIFRGWDTSKCILVAPGMNREMWSNPVTKRQISEIETRWNWIRLVTPILWHSSTTSSKLITSWNGFNEVLWIVKNQADLRGIGQEVEVTAERAPAWSSNVGGETKLPPEIWIIIMEHLGDWEIAMALGFHTNLPIPSIWSQEMGHPTDAMKVYRHELVWTTLTQDSTAICQKLQQSPPHFHDIPALAVKLIIKFELVEVLAFIETHQPELLKPFAGTTLPTIASVSYPHTSVLDYWKQSAWFHDRHDWGPEAMDGASKHGHVQVLDWWWNSGLQLRYTEDALEQASSYGQLLVLNWWRDAAADDDQLVLRPGRSLLKAAEYGQADVLRWWDASGIPVAHSSHISEVASRWGQVKVLEEWRRLKADDFAFDAYVLALPTKFHHIEVLEWWWSYARGQLPGMQGREHAVEYRGEIIWKAIRDCVGDSSHVQEWWIRNGLDRSTNNSAKELSHRTFL